MTAPAAPPAGAGCTSRWRDLWAAWERRGRGSKPRSRAAALPAQSASLRERNAPRRDRVVEVTRGFAVNGDDGQRAIVTPTAQLARRDYRLKLLRLLQDLDGKAVRQVVLADDDFDIHAEIVLVAEDLDYAAARVLGWRRPIGDLHIHDEAFEVVPLVAAGFFAEDAIACWLALATCFILPMWLRLGRRLVAAWPLHPARDDDVLGDLLVHRRDVVVSRAVMKRADDGGVSSSEHAQDASFGAAVLFLAAQFDQHLVAVH